jgi:hypothetical protein
VASLDAVLSRVEKLLALATSSNVHEAALAASRAQALIEEHRLEELLAERADAGVEIGEDTLESVRRPRTWRAVLGQGIASNNGCICYSVVVGSETELRVVGRDADRAAVRTLFAWLAPRIEWLSATHGPNKSRAWHDAFRVGAATEVVARLGPDEVVEEHALLRADRMARNDAVERWAERNLRLGAGRGLSLDPRGYRQGKKAAGELKLPG